MRIFPAVDILGGRCVQLVQGRRESATVFGDPLSCATRWLDQGADALHVVNLDGAFGASAKNAELIMELIKKTGVEIELGGGIRSAGRCCPVAEYRCLTDYYFNARNPEAGKHTDSC